MVSDNKEITEVKKEIDNWFYSSENLLTVCARPLQKNNILYELIGSILKNRGNVLYIWGNSKVDEKMVQTLNLSSKRYSYSREGLDKGNLQFMNTKYMYNVSKNYNLIIVDEVSAYTRLLDEEYKSLYIKLRSFSDKILFFSLSSISKERFIDIRNIEKKEVFVQPRVILTRINLKSDVPISLYDYIVWYKSNRKNLVIYVPIENDLENTYEYYSEKLNLRGVKVIKNSESMCRSMGKSLFLVTNKIRDVIEAKSVDGIIVLNADDKRVDYKKILFICGKVGLKLCKFSEVLLACRVESKDIEKSLKIIRDFNKKLWD